MPSLADSQARFVACLQKGPAHFPEELFAEGADRAMLGLKAHANTISHARLVALEHAFPKLYAHLGHEPFHALSRDYIEQDHILTCDMNSIAADFAAFLAQRDRPATEIDLARIEWAWIESYHSAEAAAMTLNDIATLDEASLLAFPIAVHPAMRLIALTGPLSPELAELGDEAPDALMVARPEAEVLFHPIARATHQIVEKIANISTMGNLLALTIEQGSEQDDESQAMAQIITLIQAGILMKG